MQNYHEDGPLAIFCLQQSGLGTVPRSRFANLTSPQVEKQVQMTFLWRKKRPFSYNFPLAIHGTVEELEDAQELFYKKLNHVCGYTEESQVSHIASSCLQQYVCSP